MTEAAQVKTGFQLLLARQAECKHNLERLSQASKGKLSRQFDCLPPGAILSLAAEQPTLTQSEPEFPELKAPEPIPYQFDLQPTLEMPKPEAAFVQEFVVPAEIESVPEQPAAIQTAEVRPEQPPMEVVAPVLEQPAARRRVKTTLIEPDLQKPVEQLVEKPNAKLTSGNDIVSTKQPERRSQFSRQFDLPKPAKQEAPKPAPVTPEPAATMPSASAAAKPALTQATAAPSAPSTPLPAAAAPAKPKTYTAQMNRIPQFMKNQADNRLGIGAGLGQTKNNPGSKSKLPPIDRARMRRPTMQRKVLKDEIIKNGMERVQRQPDFWVDSATA